MGRASRRKREQRETEIDKPPVPAEWVDLVVHAGVAMATGEGGEL